MVCGKPIGADTALPGVPICSHNDDTHRAARSEYDSQGLIPAYLTEDKQPWRPEGRREA